MQIERGGARRFDRFAASTHAAQSSRPTCEPWSWTAYNIIRRSGTRRDVTIPTFFDRLTRNAQAAAVLPSSGLVPSVAGSIQLRLGGALFLHIPRRHTVPQTLAETLASTLKRVSDREGKLIWLTHGRIFYDDRVTPEELVLAISLLGDEQKRSGHPVDLKTLNVVVGSVGGQPTFTPVPESSKRLANFASRAFAREHTQLASLQTELDARKQQIAAIYEKLDARKQEFKILEAQIPLLREQVELLQKNRSDLAPGGRPWSKALGDLHGRRSQ
jgi:hypothetical protein